MQKHVMKLFSQPTADWFSDTFGMPTRVQEEAWAAIAKDKDVLVSAPTGTGKTLSAFLIFIDRLNALGGRGRFKRGAVSALCIASEIACREISVRICAVLWTEYRKKQVSRKLWRPCGREIRPRRNVKG